MTHTTPAAGTYYVSFSASGHGNSTNGSYFYSIYLGGAQVTHTQRLHLETAGNAASSLTAAFHTQGVLTVNGAQDIDVRVRISVGAGTMTIYERSLTILRVA